jgi:hypothetical protein
MVRCSVQVVDGRSNPAQTRRTFPALPWNAG